jgi:D-alanyl-D-alanine carboxypeptidase/D-alanyl-D-alanine-endopeptidase (penicillin-binding protein 4)
VPRLPLFTVTLLSLLAAPASAQEAAKPDTLEAKLAAVTGRPEYAHSRWGMLFVDAKTGETVYAKNAEQFFCPASVTKLFSCGAAMAAFGADYRFVTPLHRRGEVKDGKLDGDLILVAQGDLTFGARRGKGGKIAFKDNDHIYTSGLTADAEVPDTDPLTAFDDLARQVKVAGITHVAGDILVDTRLFAPARSTGSGPAAVSPMVVNDNVIDLILTPGKAVGDLASVEVRPKTGYLRGDIEVRTTAKGSKPAMREPNEDPSAYVLRGSLPIDSKPVVSLVAIERPAEFARVLLIEALRRQGVRVDAPLFLTPTAPLPDGKPGYDKLPVVAKYTSEPLIDALKVTLKVSHNLYASTLPCLLAAKAGKTTLKAGLLEEGKQLKALGVDMEAVSFGGGAGGSRADNVTPRAVVQLLQGLKKREDWPQFVDALPVLGEDGTLATVVPKASPARGKVHAKTGTYYWDDDVNGQSHLNSKAMAGTMTTKSGRELLFAAFVNDVPLTKGVKPKREGMALGTVAEIVYEAE